MNKDIVELFSMDASSQTNNYQQYNEASMYFQGYSVDKNGNISVPILGEIYVQDLSMDEINKIILEKVEEYIKDPTIIVKLANFRITLLGEIRSPGIYTSYNNQISIFQALSMGGDVTDYGNRKNVLLIRPAKNGSSTIRIDLTDKNLIASEYYYLKPNDLIYVEPMKSKGIRLIASDYGVLLATISSTLTTILLLLQL
jgi:polysaccharide export outer membrane protein